MVCLLPLCDQTRFILMWLLLQSRMWCLGFSGQVTISIGNLRCRPNKLMQNPDKKKISWVCWNCFVVCALEQLPSTTTTCYISVQWLHLAKGLWQLFILIPNHMSASYNAKYPDKWCWCELATFELHSFTCPKAKNTDIFKMVKKTKKPETNVLCCGCRLFTSREGCVLTTGFSLNG